MKDQYDNMFTMEEAKDMLLNELELVNSKSNNKIEKLEKNDWKDSLKALTPLFFMVAGWCIIRYLETIH